MAFDTCTYQTNNLYTYFTNFNLPVSTKSGVPDAQSLAPGVPSRKVLQNETMLL